MTHRAAGWQGVYAVCVIIIEMLRPAAVSACSCAQPPAPAEAKEQADAVFLGTVEHLVLADHDKGSRVTETVATLKVKAGWKGVHEARVEIYTPPEGGSCGYAFKTGETHLVYATRVDGHWFTPYHGSHRTSVREGMGIDSPKGCPQKPLA